MLRIGDFSKLSRVSVKALRFYDEIGLLKPTYVDRFTGYRYYAPNLVSRLNRILVFKELGFSLEEIASLLQKEVPTDRMREVLESKRAELSHRIAQEQTRLSQIEAWLMQIEEDGRVPDYEVMLKQVLPQLVASVRDTIASYEDAGELFVELNRHLKRHNTTGQQAAIWHACAHRGERIDCEAVVYLETLAPESRRVRIYELPAATSASIIHQGSDETFPQAYSAVRSWIKAHGYTIAGPNRELYWQGSSTTGQDGQQAGASSVTEIQYPIFKSQPATF